MATPEEVIAKRRPTMSDVARAAGVSPATVSYVLGGRLGDKKAGRISSETTNRVLEAVEAIGYSINEPARNLRRNRTDRVLLLMDRLSSPYEQHLASTLELELDKTGRTLSIMVCTTRNRLETALNMLRTRHADGAIIQCRTVPNAQQLLEAHARDRIPMVAISNVLQPKGFDVVSNDEVPAINTAVDHLIARGHRRFGFLAHEVTGIPSESRLLHVRKRLQFHGLSLDDAFVIPGARDRIIAFTTSQQLIARPDAPTALLSASDTGAISALWAALSLGRKVPDDIAIIGAGNIDEAQVTVPPLSSVGPTNPDFASIARLLIERLDNPNLSEDRHLMLPWEFHSRGSS